ncbi:MAG TPA: hypothetical protein VNN77_09495 [candidate division Zixibacteria bacterium]|nr:hypothetical protein [candidate division Zixibacteria bacterium]
MSTKISALAPIFTIFPAVSQNRRASCEQQAVSSYRGFAADGWNGSSCSNGLNDHHRRPFDNPAGEL